ncbi:hypothetical protein PYW07_016342 [Mythimna separata]|uniref:Uncharacterized protein n=1 Tax=Mythimna separata TaxID=271217 RepID=A0AAD8DRG1_MYTSE|nr:hypothetical protein PYW07_016342 [Mythimna separata]
MASDLAIGSNEQTTNNQFGRVLCDQAPELRPLSTEAFTRSSRESNVSTSCYTLASDDSRYNYETTREESATEDTGVQNSRQVLVQSATLAPSDSLDRSGIMYFMALLMPLVSVSNFDIQWRCTPSAILHATEIILVQLSRLFGQVRAYLRQLANDQIARDLFATAMDVVLVIYAIGFLFLSLYQASIFA